MKAILFMYDIPTTVRPEDYPSPSTDLRCFAARIEYSCWVVPEGQMPRTEPIAAALRAVGAKVDTVRFDESDEVKIRSLARASIEREATRIRKYVEASISTTADKLTEAKTEMSANKTNAAIRYQQTAITRARTELNDAESCALAFDLDGDLAELVRATRAVIEARATAFLLEKKTARADTPATTATEPDDDLPFGSTGSGGTTH
jgi:hypothetical protein